MRRTIGHGAPTLALDGATATGNSDGVVAGNLANVRLGRSTVTGNRQAGLRISGGTASSLGNNNFTDNTGGNVVGGALGSYSPL